MYLLDFLLFQNGFGRSPFPWFVCFVSFTVKAKRICFLMPLKLSLSLEIPCHGHTYQYCPVSFHTLLINRNESWGSQIALFSPAIRNGDQFVSGICQLAHTSICSIHFLHLFAFHPQGKKSVQLFFFYKKPFCTHFPSDRHFCKHGVLKFTFLYFSFEPRPISCNPNICLYWKSLTYDPKKGKSTFFT